DNSVTAIYQDFRGRMWIGSEKSIYIISRETGKCSKLRNSEVENYGIINGIYGSQNGTIFITLDNRNIIKINANVQSFEKITSLFEGKNVRSIAKDADNNLWVGTGNSGLFKLIDSNPEKYIQYQHNPDDNTSLNSNYITAIHIDAYQRLWLGTFKDGFCFADGFSETGQLFFERSNFDRKVEIHEFTEGPDGNLWISTESGFYIYNRKLDTLVHYGDLENQLKEVQNFNIQSVVHNPPNEFWLATWNKGVCKLIINSDSLLSTKVSKDSILVINKIQSIDGKLLDNRFISILKDQKNILWLASFSDGLVKLEITSMPFKFSNYGKSSGAPTNTVNAIIDDHEGNIWVSTLKGLAKFDPIDERFFSYHEIDGLHSNSFIWDSYYQEENGKMYFGGINGITSFYPDSIRNNIKSPKSYISRLTINHKEQQFRFYR
ncbi:MAG: ligand-binding sensor domain-containing protein, partial [Candidatus Cyclobacteriaceae bacterium M3_2C_046]